MYLLLEYESLFVCFVLSTVIQNIHRKFFTVNIFLYIFGKIKKLIQIEEAICMSIERGGVNENELFIKD